MCLGEWQILKVYKTNQEIGRKGLYNSSFGGEEEKHKTLFEKERKKGWRCGLALSKHKALNSNPSTAKKNSELQNLCIV
jgi:hypothetical protein